MFVTVVSNPLATQHWVKFHIQRRRYEIDINQSVDPELSVVHQKLLRLLIATLGDDNYLRSWLNLRSRLGENSQAFVDLLDDLASMGKIRELALKGVI